jgi:histidine phosphotransferase ChpT
MSDIHSLVASRICHDLISPIGAVDNGIELLGMTQRLSSPEMALIRQSTSTALTRIELFRLAFGVGGASPCPIGRLNNTLTAHLGDRKITLSIGVKEPTLSLAKRISLAALCIETCLPRGGAVTIDRSPQDAGLFLTATGAIRLDTAPLWELVTAGEPPADLPRAADVHFLLLGDLLRTEGTTPALSIDTDVLTLAF